MKHEFCRLTSVSSLNCISAPELKHKNQLDRLKCKTLEHPLDASEFYSECSDCIHARFHALKRRWTARATFSIGKIGAHLRESL